jgi:glucose/arabinose dehydrogenase
MLAQSGRLAIISLLILLLSSSVLLLLNACGGSASGNSTVAGGTPAPQPQPSPPPTPSPQPLPTPAPQPPPTPPPTPPPPPPSTVPVVDEVIASGLTNPWALAFTPDGRLFFTEQPGRIRVITAGGRLLPTPAYDATNIVPGGEAGMLGLAPDPNFASNHFLYVFYCQRNPALSCNIVRLVEKNNVAAFDRVVFGYSPSGVGHIGGRLKIGPDHLLYLSSGDWMVPDNAQNLDVKAGKILRLTLNGQPASGNPFADPQSAFVYTYGNRDPQGLAFDSSGQLYETEHGPVSNDEVNIVRAGGNYGYPICVGICNDSQFIDPIKLFSPETAPPSGATFYNGSTIPQWDGSFFFAVLGLSGNTFAHHLHRLRFDSSGTKIVEEEVLYRGKYGRIRDVIEGPDSALYFCSANGKGTDVIVRVKPK